MQLFRARCADTHNVKQTSFCSEARHYPHATNAAAETATETSACSTAAPPLPRPSTNAAAAVDTAAAARRASDP